MSGILVFGLWSLHLRRPVAHFLPGASSIPPQLTFCPAKSSPSATPTPPLRILSPQQYHSPRRKTQSTCSPTAIPICDDLRTGFATPISVCASCSFLAHPQLDTDRRTSLRRIGHATPLRLCMRRRPVARVKGSETEAPFFRAISTTSFCTTTRQSHFLELSRSACDPRRLYNNTVVNRHNSAARTGESIHAKRTTHSHKAYTAATSPGCKQKTAQRV